MELCGLFLARILLYWLALMSIQFQVGVIEVFNVETKLTKMTWLPHL
jgi:hypothetical protein